MVIPLRDENPTRHTPWLTLGLIAVNVLVFFAVQPNTFGLLEPAFQTTQAAAEEQRFIYEHAVIPCEVTQGAPLSEAQIVTGRCDLPPEFPTRPVFDDKSILFSIVASMFMHGGILHLGGNMLFLWIFGNNVEDRFAWLGYALFYGFTGALATLAHVFTQPDSTIPLIGASGAVAGVMGAYLVFWPRARIVSLVPVFLIFFVRLPAAVVLGLWFFMQFFTNPNSGVAWVAHVGGFVAGAAIAWLFRPRRRPASLPPSPPAGW